MAIEVGRSALSDVNNLRGMKNQITNGDMSVWQSGDSGSRGPVVGYAGPDMICADTSPIGGFSWSKSTDTPPGFTYSLSLIADTSTNDMIVRCPVELPLMGRPGLFAMGARLILSAWVKSETTTNVRALLQFVDTNQNNSNAVQCTTTAINNAVVQNIWTRVHYVVDIDAAPAASNNCASCVFYGNGGEGLNRINITGVQLEQAAPGQNLPTAYEHRPAGLELSLCQRYYQIYDVIVLNDVNNTSTGNNRSFQGPRTTTMRAVPTLTPTTTSTGRTIIWSQSIHSIRAAVSNSPNGVTEVIFNSTHDARL